MTGCDLYQAICELSERHRSGDRTLEHYLLALVNLTRSLETRTGLLTAEFYGLLSDAFEAPPMDFDESWSTAYESSKADGVGYRGWLSTAIRQIIDLREMEACGTLANEHRWGGIDSPRGDRWFNFDPASYLECAIAGTGWDEPQSDELLEISWEMFADFLYLGQTYE
ncbi:MAG: hypothetical protein JWN70_4412 [Planctomycetaceae bacterium]|nr:hypothetical protein [Planctomycetaceae bacterium]